MDEENKEETKDEENTNDIEEEETDETDINPEDELDVSDEFYDDEDIPMYSGRCYHVTLKNGDKSIITFPEWNHLIVVENGTELCRSEDLQAGMIISSGGDIRIVDDIEVGLYHGLFEGFFLGYPLEDDELPEPRKDFVRNIYEDGRIEWKLEKIYDDRKSSTN